MPFWSLARIVGVALLTLAVAGSELLAADQKIFGKKLLIKNPPAAPASNKVVHLGKDPNITIGTAGGAGDPQCSGASGGGTSSLRIVASGGAGDVTIPLACTGWTTNQTNSVYKYKDPSEATCTVVLVKHGVLAKAVCKGSQVAIDLNGTMSPTAVVLTLNSERYCTAFGGIASKDGSDNKTFHRKDALAPVSCGAISSSTSTTTTSSNTTSSSTTTTVLGACGNLISPVCAIGACPPDETCVDGGLLQPCVCQPNL